MPFWTYMLHCRGGKFYVGHTDNLEHRLAQHQRGTLPGFTRDRLPVELVWSQDFPSRLEALEAERRIKGWGRPKKMALIRGDWDEIGRLAKEQGSASTSSAPAGLDVVLQDPAATEAFGVRLAAVVRPGDVITLSGPLGAGKTSIARGLLAALGLEGEAPSPSFAIVQPYAPPEVRLPVLHVDLYRIEEPAELDQLGLEEALADAVLLVEWPEQAPGRWPEALGLALSVERGGGRRLTADVPAAWKERWPLT